MAGRELYNSVRAGGHPLAAGARAVSARREAWVAGQLAGARRLRWFLGVLAAAVVILAVTGAV